MPRRRWHQLFVRYEIFATRRPTETRARPNAGPTGSMTPMHNFAVLEILLYEQLVGTLTRLPGDRVLFAFTEGYIADENRPTLSLSFKDAFGCLITDVRPTQTRLPVFFANLLPEGTMREYLAARAGVKPEREFFLIAILGRDLPGAIQIRPAGDAIPLDENVDVSADAVEAAD